MSLLSSVKKAVKQVGGAALTAAGAYYGGPAGASFASNLGRSMDLDTSGLLGSVVNGAVGLGSDYLQSQANLKNQKDLASYAAEKQNELNEAAFQRNLQQWNMENAYNSPAAQMQRFAEAGLNPNRIYDQSNTAASSPTFEAPKYDVGHYNPVDTRMQRAQLALALVEHKQLIENQAIQNDLARQKLTLAARASDRDDKLADAQIAAYGANLGLTNAKIYDLNDRIESGYKSDLGKYWHDIEKIFKGSSFHKGTGGASADLF